MDIGTDRPSKIPTTKCSSINDVVFPSVAKALQLHLLWKDAKKASQMKQEGNQYFKSKKYRFAADCYTEALDFSPLGDEHNYSKAVYHSNRAACYLHMTLYDKVIEDCSRAIEFCPRSVKAFMRRAAAFEATEKLDLAIADVKAAIAIAPTYMAGIAECARLEKKHAEAQERMKTEVVGKLKELGNMFLSNFGLSVDNFQAKKDPATGSYSVNFTR